MRFPVAHERVRLQGRNGTYLVLTVDRSRSTADVISTAPGSHAESVPLSAVLPLSASTARTNRDAEPGEVS